jgi:alpha-tubulin suppressor-like RCC1 family protein
MAGWIAAAPGRGSRFRCQQYIIQSTIPICSVAATTPKTNAAFNPALPPLSFMPLVSPLGVRVAAAIILGSLLACTEPTTSVRRFAVLDDVGGSDWQSVSVGGEHSCALKAGGAAYCWGSNDSGQLGVAPLDTICGTAKAPYRCSLRPRLVSAELQFLSISAGARHSCGITTTHAAYCWGSNEQRQVGDLTSTGPSLTRIPSTLGWAQISAGYTHTCGVRTDGALFCWGANDRGQIGNGSLGNDAGVSRVQFNAPIAFVSASQQRTCARTTVGALFCWGALWTGRENGLEITRSQVIPQAVPSAPAMATLSVGAFTTCGADRTGLAYCWEANPRGEMGTGSELGALIPQRVAGGLAFAQVSAGIVQTCGIAVTGTGYCWGDDTFGQLGTSPSLLVDQCGSQRLPCSKVPISVFGRQRFTEISTGQGSHTCGVTTQGNLYCWGLGLSGQRGDGTALYAISVPVLVKEP